MIKEILDSIVQLIFKKLRTNLSETVFWDQRYSSIIKHCNYETLGSVPKTTWS